MNRAWLFGPSSRNRGRLRQRMGRVVTRLTTSLLLGAVAAWVVSPLPISVLGFPAAHVTAPVVAVGAMGFLRLDPRPSRIVTTGLRCVAGCVAIHPLFAFMPALQRARDITQTLATFESLVVWFAIGLVGALVLAGLGSLVTRWAESRRHHRSTDAQFGRPYPDISGPGIGPE